MRKLIVSGIVLLALVLMITNLVWAETGTELVTKAYSLEYSSSPEMAKILEKELPPCNGRKIEIRERMNVLVITDLSENHNRIKKILNDYDKVPQKIRVEALLIVAPLTVLKELGISADLKKMPDEELLSACSKREDVILLSHPMITVLEGIKGGSKIGSPVQYMEKLKNGKFVLKTYEISNGFEATAKVENNDYITVNIDFKVGKLNGRLPIEGVQLDIGYPIINSFSTKTTAKVKNGEVVCLGGGVITDKSNIIDSAGESSVIKSEKKEIILLTAHIL